MGWRARGEGGHECWGGGVDFVDGGGCAGGLVGFVEMGAIWGVGSSHH